MDLRVSRSILVRPKVNIPAGGIGGKYGQDGVVDSVDSKRDGRRSRGTC